MVDGLHAVHESQDEVPDLLLVAVEELHVHVISRLQQVQDEQHLYSCRFCNHPTDETLTLFLFSLGATQIKS